MKRTMCCPKCKNMDLVIPPDLKDKVLCHQCNYTFHSLDYLKEKKIVLNRFFTASMIIFITTLLLGTYLFFMPVYGEYNLPMQAFIMKLEGNGISENNLVTTGIILYIMALISMICVFVSAYYSNKYHERRMYLRKHGYIYEKREKCGSNRD